MSSIVLTQQFQSLRIIPNPFHPFIRSFLNTHSIHTLKLSFTMKNQINLTKLVDLLANYITAGISINVDSDSEVKTISVSNSRNGNTVKFAFKVMPYGPYCEIIDWQETPEQANTPQD